MHAKCCANYASSIMLVKSSISYRTWSRFTGVAGFVRIGSKPIRLSDEQLYYSTKLDMM
jgi:transcription antitermination factor NusG